MASNSTLLAPAVGSGVALWQLSASNQQATPSARSSATQRPSAVIAIASPGSMRGNSCMPVGRTTTTAAAPRTEAPLALTIWIGTTTAATVASFPTAICETCPRVLARHGLASSSNGASAPKSAPSACSRLRASQRPSRLAAAMPIEAMNGPLYDGSRE